MYEPKTNDKQEKRDIVTEFNAVRDRAILDYINRFKCDDTQLTGHDFALVTSSLEGYLNNTFQGLEVSEEQRTAVLESHKQYVAKKIIERHGDKYGTDYETIRENIRAHADSHDKCRQHWNFLIGHEEITLKYSGDGLLFALIHDTMSGETKPR